MTMTMTRRWRWRWWCCCGINLGNTGSIIVSCQCRHVISYRIHRVNGWACSKPPCSQQKPANTCSPKCNHPREEHFVPWTCCHTFLLVGRIWSSLPKLPTWIQFGKRLRPCAGKMLGCWCCCCVTGSRNPIATSYRKSCCLFRFRERMRRALNISCHAGKQALAPVQCLDRIANWCGFLQ